VVIDAQHTAAVRCEVRQSCEMQRDKNLRLLTWINAMVRPAR